ncbi:hypothetical protein LXA43DRAFT_1168945 [Ganoderma leucocontextum]|nr:hypothetical protein LXA43DRAFT_1168945 [Ganoderma leucocontextum]
MSDSKFRPTSSKLRHLQHPSSASKEMEWWEDEEDEWFHKYLPGHDLPDGLEWTPFSVDLTTDPEVTTCMYPGLQKGLQDAIMTAGCDDLEALITYRSQYDDASSDSSCNEPTPERWPALGIYSTSCSHLGVLRSAATSQVPTDLSLELARCSDVDVLVEVRRATVSSIGTPTTNPPSPYATSSGTASAPKDISCFDFDLDGDEESVVGVFNCQHRLFVFMILFVEGKARLLRFDRTGASMTPEFDYTQRPEVIGKFLYRLSRNRAAIGHDPTATRANEADTELFRNLHTRYPAASAVGCGLRGAAMEGWPIYKLRIEGRFSPDGSTAVPPNAPISQQEYLIGQPMHASGSLIGRGTKTHVAYDMARGQVVVIKDSWRPNSKNIRSEYDTYLLLNAAEIRPGQPFSIPTLLGGGDVPWENVTQQTRTSHPPEHLTHIHSRLVLKEVCRHLEDFTVSLELVQAIFFALDAHSVAWMAAHILHRDINANNILILDENPEGLPNPKTSKGLLADWALAATKEELEDPTFTQTNGPGSWRFMSSRLQHTDPAEQRHELSDDLESFIHVLNYCALKYLPNDLSYDGGALVPSFIDRIYDSPLHYLLQGLSELCRMHYHHIQFALPDPQYVTDPGLMSVERGRFAQMLSATKTRNPAARVVHRTVTPSTTVLPPPDPSKSPFNDHDAIVLEFLETLEPPNQEHPAYGLEWPASDKIKRVKPLSLVEPTISVSQSGKRQSGVPPYAPFGTPNPEHSAPAKRARTCASDFP